MDFTFLVEALALTKIATSCVQNAITAPVQNLLGKGYKKATAQIKNIGVDKELPENHDILKAIRTAMLRATAYMAHELAWEMEMTQSEKITKDFKKDLLGWVRKELSEIDNRIKQRNFNTEVYDHLQLLLVEPKEDLIAVKRDKFSSVVVAQWKNEIQNGLGYDLPEIIITYLEDGWKDERGNELDWFNVTSFWFAQLLAQMPEAESKFQNRVLSEMATGVEQLNEKVDKLLRLFKEGIKNGKYIESRWVEKIQHQLDRVERGLNVANEKLDYIALELLSQLKEKDAEIKSLQDELKEHYSIDKQEQVDILIVETEALRIAIRDKNIELEEHKGIRKELEESLSKQKESETLKKQAFEAIEEKQYGKAKELLKESAKDKINEVAEDFYQIGNASELNLEYRDALHYYELATKIAPDNVEYLYKAGSLSRDIGAVDNAILYFENAISIEIKKEGFIVLYNGIGLAWELKHEYDKAIEYYVQALVINKKYYGTLHLNVANSYNYIGGAYELDGQYNKAIEYYEKALEIYKMYKVETDPNLKGCYYNLANLYSNLGDIWGSIGEYDKSTRYYESALTLEKAYYGESHPEIAIRYNKLGAILKSKGEYDKSVEYYEKAIQVMQQFSKRVSVD